MPNYVGDALMAHAKGGCYRCGRGDSLVDMDAYVEGEGALTICKGCVLEAAEAAGLHLNGAAVAEAQQRFDSERQAFEPKRVLELEEENAALKETLADRHLLDEHVNAIVGALQRRRK